MTKSQTPVLYNAIYKFWYRDCFDMKRTITIDKPFAGISEEDIFLKVKLELGKYGAIKAERIGELHEITN